MTWKQFVDEVEKQLKEKGISDTNIWYIDVSGFTIEAYKEELHVHSEYGMGLSIS